MSIKKLFIFLFFCFLNSISIAEDKSTVVSPSSEIDIDLVGDKKIKNNLNKTAGSRTIVNLTPDAVESNTTLKEQNNKDNHKEETNNDLIKIDKIYSTRNNNDIKSVEKYIKDNYDDKFSKQVEINRDNVKKDKKKSKFKIEIVDAKDTRGGNVVKNLQEAFNFYKQKDYELAVFYYKKALLYNQNSVEARFGLGASYQMLRQYDQAINEYLKLFDANYSRRKIVNNLLLCLEHKSYEKALDILLSIDKNILGYADILTQIGIIFIKMKQNQKAIYALARAHELSPNNAIVAYNLGILYDREGNIDYAKYFFEIAIKNGIAELLNYDDNQRLEERIVEMNEQISAKIKNSKNNKK